MEEIEQPKNEENGAQFDSNNGSIGKFKDATKLYEAYSNLQAEFTRKCQELANIKKRMSSADELSKTQEKALNKDDSVDSSENNSREEETAKNEQSEPNFAQKLLEFAENHPDALSDIDAIKAEIEENKMLEKFDGGIDIAYRLVKEKQKYSPAELVASPNFVEDFVMNSEEIKTKVIDNYIKSLATEKKSPKLISGESSVSLSAETQKLSTLSDANKIFKKMLEN